MPLPFSPPAFWYRPPCWKSRLLRPVGRLYHAMVKARQLFCLPRKVAVPVVCVGNATVGGSGKTPVALAVCQLLWQAGHVPAFISRGYGGWIRRVTQVDPTCHSHKDVGDEALLLAQKALTFVGDSRVAAARAAIAAGATILILDDGLQNPSLRKDISLLVMDSQAGIGNGELMPAGPLREPLHEAMKRSQAVVVIGQETGPLFPPLPPFLPCLRAHLKPVGFIPKDIPYIAFAGIGYPEKFFRTLEDIGCTLVAKIPFPDHYVYTEVAMKKLYERQMPLVTTEKDMVRIPLEYRDKVIALPVMLEWEQPAALEKILKPVLRRGR